MKNFRFNIILRVVLLILVIGSGMMIYLQTNLTSLAFLAAVSFILQTYELIRYLDKVNDELSRFLEAMRYSDFSMHSGLRKLGGSFSELAKQINQIMDQLQNTRKEKEEQYLYLQTVVQHIGVGLITFDSAGKVELINPAAKRLLKIKMLNFIQALNDLRPGFGQYMEQLPPRKKNIYRLTISGDIVQLLMYATEFRMQNRNLKMVILQNIQSELEEQELEAWQKLIRVLTHEIINSITPISSMSGTVYKMIDDMKTDNGLSRTDAIQDILTALSAIQKRSEGMVTFVEKFRSLTKLPKPNCKTVVLSSLFDRIRILMHAPLAERNILFSMNIQPTNLELTADPDLIEQVIINLLNNAVQALSSAGKGRIEMNAAVDELGKIVIIIRDNGPGIPEDIREKIFIPFFTTRPDGSGIGLSLSRQIMRLHGGSLNVQSAPEQGAEFILKF